MFLIRSWVLRMPWLRNIPVDATKRRVLYAHAHSASSFARRAVDAAPYRNASGARKLPLNGMQEIFAAFVLQRLLLRMTNTCWFSLIASRACRLLFEATTGC